MKGARFRRDAFRRKEVGESIGLHAENDSPALAPQVKSGMANHKVKACSSLSAIRYPLFPLSRMTPTIKPGHAVGNGRQHLPRDRPAPTAQFRRANRLLILAPNEHHLI